MCKSYFKKHWCFIFNIVTCYKKFIETGWNFPVVFLTTIYSVTIDKFYRGVQPPKIFKIFMCPCKLSISIFEDKYSRISENPFLIFMYKISELYISSIAHWCKESQNKRITCTKILEKFFKKCKLNFIKINSKSS